FGKVLLEFARLEHLAHDVTAADEFALDVELRDGRPVRILLDALTQLIGSAYVDALVVDADVIEDLNNLAGETALREAWRSLHEEHDLVALDFIVDEFRDAAHIRVPFATGLKARLRLCGIAAYVFHTGAE